MSEKRQKSRMKEKMHKIQIKYEKTGEKTFA